MHSKNNCLTYTNIFRCCTQNFQVSSVISIQLNLMGVIRYGTLPPGLCSGDVCRFWKICTRPDPADTDSTPIKSNLPDIPVPVTNGKSINSGASALKNDSGYVVVVWCLSCCRFPDTYSIDDIKGIQERAFLRECGQNGALERC